LTLLIKLANAEQVGMKREEIAACENGSREWGGLLFPSRLVPAVLVHSGAHETR
jgi:hypothetical protein